MLIWKYTGNNLNLHFVHFVLGLIGQTYIATSYNQTNFFFS